MSVDYAAVALGMQQVIPLVGHLGIKVTELGPGHGVALLPDVETQRNHVGSQHAGALFTVGETASGGALAATFAERLADVTPLAESARIAYQAVARGPITATATLGSDPAELFAALEEDGRVRFEIGVVLHDARELPVAEMTVSWYVREHGVAPQPGDAA